jgi:AmpD protein
MPYPEFERLSPNRDPTAVQEHSGALFHHSEMGFAATLDHMLRPESRVSYHCLIDADGTRCTLARDDAVAWHAGASRFLGRDRCNDFLLGVAFAGDTYAAALTPAQLASALEWLDLRWAKYGWNLGRMTDHRQVAPGRKRDLNPAEWERLLAAITARFGAPKFPS